MSRDKSTILDAMLERRRAGGRPKRVVRSHRRINIEDSGHVQRGVSEGQRGPEVPNGAGGPEDGRGDVGAVTM